MAPKSTNSTLFNMPRSGVRRITEKVMELDHSQGGIIHLGFGEPQEPTPDPIRQAVIQAASEGFTKYTLNSGWPELRRAVKEKLKVANKVEVDEEDIFITPGATYGVSIAVGALINQGDEVLVPDPGYPNFAYSALHYGGKVNYYTLEERNGFQINFKNLDSLVTDKTKLLIINSPSNPTGAVLSKEQIRELVQFSREKNLWLISDEVYEAFIYSGSHVSPLSCPKSEHAIGVYSFSKTYNMTGLRVGYTVIKDKSLRKSFINAQELYISSAPSVSQVAALHALRYCEKDVENLKNRFRQKRDLALAVLKDEVHYVPEGAFYILVDVSGTGLSSDEFADLLLKEKKVAVVPGATFGPSADKFIRIALTAETQFVKEGVQRIKELLREQKKNLRPTQINTSDTAGNGHIRLFEDKKVSQNLNGNDHSLLSSGKKLALDLMPPIITRNLRKIVHPVKNWAAFRKFSDSDRNVRSDEYIQWLCSVVGGWLTPTHGNLKAFDYAVQHMPKEGAIVEIGSFLGLSTNIVAYLTIKYKRSNPFFTCDPWEFEGTEKPVGGYFDGSTKAYRQYSREVFKMNTSLFSETRKPYAIEARSSRFFELWQLTSEIQDVFGRSVTLGGSIGFAYLDGAHTYDSVKNDFQVIDRYLAPGGFILFDDSAEDLGFEGVTRAVREVRRNPSYEPVFKTPHDFFRKKF